GRVGGPAEPVKPVSQASRSSDAGTYSFWCRSARGTMKPVKCRRANSVRTALTRWALAARSAWSSNDWKRASNMAAIYGRRSGAAMPLIAYLPASPGTLQNQRRPAFEPEAPDEHESARAVARERRVGLRQEQTRQHDLPIRGEQARQRRGQPLQRLEQDVGEDQVERGAL